MKELKLKHFLDGLIFLDTINLEEKLSESYKNVEREQKKTSKLDLFDDFKNKSIFFDLSKCQFAELGALAQLILTIESYIKNNHTIFIALPSIKPSTNQKKTTENKEWVKYITDKQISATNFIKKTGFVSILQKLSKIYNTEIYFTEEYDYDKQGTEIDIESFTDTFSVLYEEILINEENYKFLLPFKLIDTKEDDLNDTISKFEKNLEKILENQERGLDNFDVKVIKNVILPELIKNVKYHSNTRYAIFTIGLINTRSIFYEEKYEEYLAKPGAKRKINPIENSHIKKIKEHKIESQVEIYFGDCGKGILNPEFEKKVIKDFNKQLSKPKEFLAIAFNRWSSIQDNNERRGTKGLYRLKRVVDKYKGMIHIKTSKSNGGFFNGQFIYQDLESKFNGTLINIRLNSQRENKTFKISNQRLLKSIPWVSEKIKIDEKLKCLEIIENKVKNGVNLLLIIDLRHFDFSNQNKLFEEFLYEISLINHPSAIVLYLINNEEIDNESIDTFINSVSERILEVKKRIKNINKDSLSPDSDEPELEDIHDPVLVITNNNKTFWYGASEKLIEILNESCDNLQEDKFLKIGELASYKKLNSREQQEISNYLETDNNLVVLDDDEMIEFNFYGIEEHYENKIKNFKPSLSNKKICTPKLSIVENWININELIEEDENGFALCLYIKYSKHCGDINKLVKHKTFVLIDSSIQLNLTKKFSELIGLKNKNIRNIEDEIDFSMPKRTKLFNEKSNVIFLTTIVSSSETIRRLVKYAKRDKAIPDVILCIQNSRIKKISKLETWNETTNIISIYQKNTEESIDVEERNDKYFLDKLKDFENPEIVINPKYLEETPKEFQNKLSIEEHILNYLKENKFLHYNHFGKYNKRHFTFYLDKLRIVDSISNNVFISEKLTSTIANWKAQNNIDKFTLYINKNLVHNQSSFELFLKSIPIAKYKFINLDHTSFNDENDKNIIYFDFGILTGDSINSLISKVENVDNLLICILFNQSINTNADIYKRIDKLKFERNFNLLETEIKKVKFQVEYLYNLPLSFFNSETCPICEHRRALDYYKLDNPYFEDFINNRSERLKQNSADDIYDLEYPVDFYYSEKKEERQQELSNVTIFQMYELKILLENAVFITQSRIELFKYIHTLYSNIEDEIKNHESKIYSLIYYLSHEINWLQREPFVFRDFRILLSKIALKVATININFLSSYFEERKIKTIPSKNLATRYKYSAISVLRSADKLLFCQNIYKIVETTKTDNNFSDNLLQNTLYHISSFFKNSYNKSEIYFFYISNELEKILKELAITDNQKDSIHFIINENKKSRLKTYSVKEEPNRFRVLKEEWMKIYSEAPRHPITYEHFKFLYISKNEHRLNDQDYLKSLLKNWVILKRYLNNLFIENFENYFDLLTNSSYFKHIFKNSIKSTEYWKGKFERMDYIINDFIFNPDTYFSNKIEYNELLESLKEVFIQNKGLSDFEENSTLITLLNDFPANITESINYYFREFPNKSFYILKNNRSNEKLFINLDEEFYVYYPSPTLNNYFNNVKQNLEKRLNNGKTINDVKIKFEIDISERDYLIVTILYDSTNENTGTIKKDGALNGWNNSLQEFGGSLEFLAPSEKSVDFKIKLKFLRYEF
jgi:hypothetical protein